MYSRHCQKSVERPDHVSSETLYKNEKDEENSVKKSKNIDLLSES